MVEKRPLEEVIAGHESRNATLRISLLQKNIDLKETRQIDCHFWAWTSVDAENLGKSLEARGFQILVNRPAVARDQPNLWNIEASVRQSIDLTMRREFTDELARLADFCRGVYDGWGTQI